MTGTATTMSIEENMAIAARRGKSRGLRWGITKAEREKYREMLSTLHLGLEDRLTSKSRSVIRWTASGNHASDGFHPETEASASR